MPDYDLIATVPQTDDEVAEFRWDDFLPAANTGSNNSFSIIDACTSLTGKYVTKSAFIHGRIDGQVFAESVSIENTGNVKGAIFCRVLSIYGHVNADVVCDSVVVRESGILQGSLKYKSLKIMPGGKVLGSLAVRVARASQ